MSKIIITNQAAPATPASGTVAIYTDPTTKKIISLDDTGASTSYAAELLTTKGDLLNYSTLPIRLPIGTDNQVLTADSAAARGMSWQNGASLTNDQITAAMWDPTSTDWNRTAKTDFQENATYDAGVGAGGLPFDPSGSITANALDIEDGLCLGTYRITTATTGADGLYLKKTQFTLTDHIFDMGIRFKFQGITDASDQFKAGVGMDTGFLNNSGVGGVFLGPDYSQNTTKMVAMSSSASTDTVTDTGIVTAADTWYNLQIMLDAGGGTPTAKYYIDGVLKATHTTNIPVTGDLYFQTFCLAIGTMSQSRYFDIDWAYFFWKHNAVRGVMRSWASV